MRHNVFEIGEQIEILLGYVLITGVITGRSPAWPHRYEVRTEGGTYVRGLQAHEMQRR